MRITSSWTLVAVAMLGACSDTGATERGGTGGSGASSAAGAAGSSTGGGTGSGGADASTGTGAGGGGTGGSEGTGGSAGEAGGADAAASDDGGANDARGAAAGEDCTPGGSGFDTSFDGVVVDKKTCLVWERTDAPKDMASCVITRDDPAKLCWAEADIYCGKLRLDGQSDWRLPTRAELRTILLSDIGLCPRIDTTAFPGALKSIYWTSEKIPPDHDWGVDFCDGMDHSAGQDGPQAVRCVRAP